MLSQLLIGVIEWVGLAVNRLKGPHHTAIYLGNTKNRVWKVQTTAYPEWVDAHILSRQVVYRTSYKRWWIPDTMRTVYVVSFAAPETLKLALKEKLDDRTYRLLEDRLNETITYPMLCGSWLRWTRFPHTYAINAFLDRVSEVVRPPLKEVAL